MNYALKNETSSTVSGIYPEALISTAARPASIGRATVFYLPTPESAVEVHFREWANQWKEETLDMSSLTDIITHPAYLRIIALGEKALPLIFDELRREPNHWFVALGAITNDDPVLPQHAGNLGEMTRAWLDWAEQNEA